jgi:hypothetical protein
MSDERGPRERAYDEEIYPLMERIITIAKANDIPMLANFQLDGDLATTTAVPAQTGHGERQRTAIEILYPRPVTFGVVIERGQR